MPPAFALSQDQTLRFIKPSKAETQPSPTNRTQISQTFIPQATRPAGRSKRLSTHSQDTSTNTQISPRNQGPKTPISQTKPPCPERHNYKGAANVSLPIPDSTLKERPDLFEPPGVRRRRERRSTRAPLPCQTDFIGPHNTPDSGNSLMN